MKVYLMTQRWRAIYNYVNQNRSSIKVGRNIKVSVTVLGFESVCCLN